MIEHGNFLALEVTTPAFEYVTNEVHHDGVLVVGVDARHEVVGKDVAALAGSLAVVDGNNRHFVFAPGLDQGRGDAHT